MTDKIKFYNKIIKIGNSRAITISTQILEYLELQIGDKITSVPEIGKKGKFISYWKKVDDIPAHEPEKETYPPTEKY
ncbi:MAG: hypothetical protein ABIG69_11815 [Bacteroidota bacterium]